MADPSIAPHLLNSPKRLTDGDSLTIIRGSCDMRPCAKIATKLPPSPLLLHREAQGWFHGCEWEWQTPIPLFDVPETRIPETPDRLVAVQFCNSLIDQFVDKWLEKADCGKHPAGTQNPLNFPVEWFDIAEPMKRLGYAHEVY